MLRHSGVKATFWVRIIVNLTFLVARRAQAILEQTNPAALAAAKAVLAALKADYPELTKDESLHPFTECALFADNIKNTGYSWQTNWHFIDIPYYNEGGEASDFTFETPTVNVVAALNALTGMLTNSGNYKSTIYY